MISYLWIFFYGIIISVSSSRASPLQSQSQTKATLTEELKNEKLNPSQNTKYDTTEKFERIGRELHLLDTYIGRSLFGNLNLNRLKSEVKIQLEAGTRILGDLIQKAELDVKMSEEVIILMRKQIETALSAIIDSSDEIFIEQSKILITDVSEKLSRYEVGIQREITTLKEYLVDVNSLMGQVEKSVSTFQIKQIVESLKEILLLAQSAARNIGQLFERIKIQDDTIKQILKDSATSISSSQLQFYLTQIRGLLEKCKIIIEATEDIYSDLVLLMEIAKNYLTDQEYLIKIDAVKIIKNHLDDSKETFEGIFLETTLLFAEGKSSEYNTITISKIRSALKTLTTAVALFSLRKEEASLLKFELEEITKYHTGTSLDVCQAGIIEYERSKASISLFKSLFIEVDSQISHIKSDAELISMILLQIINKNGGFQNDNINVLSEKLSEIYLITNLKLNSVFSIISKIEDKFDVIDDKDSMIEILGYTLTSTQELKVFLTDIIEYKLDMLSIRSELYELLQLFFYDAAVDINEIKKEYSLQMQLFKELVSHFADLRAHIIETGLKIKLYAQEVTFNCRNRQRIRTWYIAALQQIAVIKEISTNIRISYENAIAMQDLTLESDDITVVLEANLMLTISINQMRTYIKDTRLVRKYISTIEQRIVGWVFEEWRDSKDSGSDECNIGSYESSDEIDSKEYDSKENDSNQNDSKQSNSDEGGSEENNSNANESEEGSDEEGSKENDSSQNDSKQSNSGEEGSQENNSNANESEEGSDEEGSKENRSDENNSGSSQGDFWNNFSENFDSIRIRQNIESSLKSKSYLRNVVANKSKNTHSTQLEIVTTKTDSPLKQKNQNGLDSDGSMRSGRSFKKLRNHVTNLLNWEDFVPTAGRRIFELDSERKLSEIKKPEKSYLYWNLKSPSSLRDTEKWMISLSESAAHFQNSRLSGNDIAPACNIVSNENDDLNQYYGHTLLLRRELMGTVGQIQSMAGYSLGLLRLTDLLNKKFSIVNHDGLKEILSHVNETLVLAEDIANETSTVLTDAEKIRSSDDNNIVSAPYYFLSVNGKLNNDVNSMILLKQSLHGYMKEIIDVHLWQTIRNSNTVCTINK